MRRESRRTLIFCFAGLPPSLSALLAGVGVLAVLGAIVAGIASFNRYETKAGELEKLKLQLVWASEQLGWFSSGEKPVKSKLQELEATQSKLR